MDDLVGRLAATSDEATRRRTLAEAALLPHVYPPAELAERLKLEADQARYQDSALSLRWCGDIVALGRAAAKPAVVALGRMVEALLLYDQDRYRDSLALFDEASALFRGEGDDVGWARAQIGRTVACMALARFDEALERAYEARAILVTAGESVRVASLDHNLAILLERMNRPADALIYSERALAAHRVAGSEYYAVVTLANQALLLWRLGRVREALAAHREAQRGYVALGAAIDAAQQNLNIGVTYLALGRFAEAQGLLMTARRDLQAAESPYTAAVAGLHLAECLVRLGRFREAVRLTEALADEFRRCEAIVKHAQSLVWQASAYIGLREHDAALHTLDAATALLAGHEGLALHGAIIDVFRAQLLLERDQPDEATPPLRKAVPALREAGLTVETATAQVLWGDALARQGYTTEAAGAAGAALAVAEREGLDWLAARALHLQGRIAMRQGAGRRASDAFAAAARRLDRVHRHVAWDDHATFSDTITAVYVDAMELALQRRQPALALRYAERSKARALADHLRGRIDVRPRARDERSRELVDELEALRERYAWLASGRLGQGQPARQEETATAVRWATGLGPTAENQGEATRLEQRMAEIWRELQVNNPAYRGEAAALDLLDDGDNGGDDDEAARRWLDRAQAALGRDDGVALLEYAALGEDLALFVVRAGTVRVVRLSGAVAEARRLVPLLRLNVERSAATIASGGAAPALGAHARGVLRRLYDALLAPAAPLLDGATRLVVVPHGLTHHAPFHALYDGRSYLIERHEVSYAPCAGLIEHFAARYRLSREAHRARERGALALTYTNGDALPHAGAEGQAVVAALGGLLLREGDATLGNLRAHAGDRAALHLATHARFRPDEPLFSALQLYDGGLSTLEVFELDLNCSLVTLSACETALGTAGAGDELMGLSRAFLYAGAPSLVLSLWKVEDRSSAALMDIFYRSLREGVGKAAALRRAQLALLRHEVEADRDYSAPFFWAPFELIGHDGPL